MLEHMETAYQNTLRRAVRAAGGEEKLAVALGAKLAEVESWLAGDAHPPYETFIAALTLANQASAGERRSASK
ncbi:MAG TPA: hypothetical protein VI321_05235 [Burkholderiales bacterium]